MYAIIQRHKRLAAIIIAVASLSFLFWMFSITDIKQMFGLQRCVATVNGNCITLREYRYELLRYADLLEKEEWKKALKNQIVYNLINREALYQEARKLGFVASDKEVANIIKGDQSFMENGKFSFALYKRSLERIGLTPKEYEKYIKKQLTIQKLLDFISKAVYLTDREELFQQKLLYTKFEGKVYFISPSTVKVNYKPTIEELKDFYSKNKEMFLSKQKRVYIIWKTREKEKAHSLYNSLKKGNIPKSGIELTDNELKNFPKGVVNELKKLNKRNKYSITKAKGYYYVLYLKSFKQKNILPFDKVKERIKQILIERKKVEFAEKKAYEVKNKILKGEGVNIKYIKFDNSSAEEFLKLFKLNERDLLRLVFSKEKVFGPYRRVDGFVVIYVEDRKLDLKNIKEKSVKEDFLKAKENDLIKLYVKKVVSKADVKINEEYLR